MTKSSRFFRRFLQRLMCGHAWSLYRVTYDADGASGFEMECIRCHARRTQKADRS